MEKIPKQKTVDESSENKLATSITVVVLVTSVVGFN